MMSSRIEARLEKLYFKMGLLMRIRDLPPDERSRLIDDICSRHWDIPGSTRKTISRSTVYRWLSELRSSSDPTLDLLDRQRSDKGTFRTLTDYQKKTLIAWRSENLFRTVANLKEELLSNDMVEDRSPVPSESTIARFLRSVRLDRKTMKARQVPGFKAVRLSFEADYPQQLWQADTKGQKIKAINPETGELLMAKPIVIIDDSSRYIVGLKYVFEENEAMVVECVKTAIIKFGVPETLYCDLGSPYSGRRLERAMTLLGCKLIHTGKGDCEAKGKIEKFMQYLNDSLETELKTREAVCTLPELNEYACALVSQDYHKRIHSATRETPESRYSAFPEEYRRFVSNNTLSLVFMDGKEATVSKTGIIRFGNKEYLIPDKRLFRQKVEIRFDDRDSHVDVWFEDNYYGQATLHKADNDYLKRLEITDRLCEHPPQIEAGPAPAYNRLERIISEYHIDQQDCDVNSELKQLLEKREELRSHLTPRHCQSSSEEITDFGRDEFCFLLSTLLRQKFTSHENLTIRTVWNHYGPFEEPLVRKTVGKLLGSSHPTTDLAGYLEAIRFESTKPEGDDLK